MAVVTELFRSEDNGTLSFGDYTLAQKAKKGDIQFEGDIYKIKTFKTVSYTHLSETFLLWNGISDKGMEGIARDSIWNNLYIQRYCRTFRNSKRMPCCRYGK